MVDKAVVSGVCDPWFSAVQDVFEQHFSDGLEQGAAVCVIVDGQIVVDLWAGATTRAQATPWQRDTIVNCYSATKGVSALCIHKLADEGRIDLDARVAKYWPEFGELGKERVTVAQLLSHQAGLSAIERPFAHESLYQHSVIAAALAAQAPSYPPGTSHSYHAQTFGFLVGELVRRVTGETLGEYLANSIAGPRGLDFQIGFGDGLDHRVAQVSRPLGALPPPGQPDLLSVFKQEPTSLTARAFRNPRPKPGAVHTRAYRAAELPGSNGHGTARALAGLYGAALGIWGQPLLSAAALRRCCEVVVDGHDEVLRVPTRFGEGFMISAERDGARMGVGASNKTFGHPGMGGTMGCADPSAGLAFGYTVNRAAASILIDPRANRLLDAAFASI